MMASLLAQDLDLPVPSPRLVEIENGFDRAVAQPEVAQRLRESVGWNFGSKKLDSGFTTWPRDKPIPLLMRPLAAEVFAFDAIIQNPDRRKGNPNVLWNGDDLFIYDHELSLTFFLPTLGWQAPWSGRGLEFLRDHVFYGGLEALYVRMVQRYEERQQLPSREEEEIWKDFRKELERHHVLAHLHTKRIIAKDYDYEFQHARKNEVWHMYEPVSLDLIHAESILDKANRWFGRIFNLQDSEDKFTLYMLLGEPRDDKLKGAFAKAKNILHKMPVNHEFVSEREASKFSTELAEEIKKHVGESGE